MIKEHDQQAKIKSTPRKLAYVDSDNEASALSLAKGFSGRFSLESSGTSDTYRQTRSASGATRNWFDDLDPKSVDSFEELSQKFLEEFSQQKRYAKYPTEIHDIKRRQNVGLQAFMDRFKSESSHIKGVPPVLRISAFMHSHGHLELAKKLNVKIPKTVDEMFERVRAFIRGEVVARSAGLIFPRRQKTLKEVLSMESVSFLEPPPLIRTLEKQNLNKFCDYHGDIAHNTNNCYQLRKQIDEAVVSGKLAHLVKDIRQNNQRNGNQGRNDVFGRNVSPPGVNKSSSNYGKGRKKIREQAILRARSNSRRRPGLGLVSLEKIQSKEDIKEVFTISHERPDQYVTMGAMLTTNCKQLLADILRGNMEEYSQIRMAEDDEEKIGFHTEEGVYCFTRMPKELKNSAATLRRMMEMVFANQRGRNVKIHLEDTLIKRKSEHNLIKDFKETLRKVNIKIDLTMSSFGVIEGKFLCHMTISSALLIEREEIHIPVSNVSRPLQGMDIYYIPMEKRIQALINTTRSLRIIVRKHKVKVVTDGPIEKILKLSKKERRLAKWAAEIRTYDISYSLRKEAEGLVIKKFFGQGEHVEGTPDANERGTFTLTRSFKKNQPQHQGLGGWSYTPVTEQERKYKEEILDAKDPFHRFQITHLPKVLNSKAKVLTGLATIKLEFLNREVSVGIKTRPSVEETSSSKKGKAASNAPRAEPYYNHEASESN
uniref:Reverse transcriptase domain-containing protein n=1 Tax=Tanacetum cinerariifolium TaxID=118510 RepID=A0A6L2JAU9_TANCI|nr:reverse transcriptase domain-containing protein [Tanacetum cinerariifolium]